MCLIPMISKPYGHMSSEESLGIDASDTCLPSSSVATLKRWRFSGRTQPPSRTTGMFTTEQDRRSGRDRTVNGKDTRPLNRREFNGVCVALSWFVTSSGAAALDAASGVASTGAGRPGKFRDGTVVQALGQGSAGLAKGRHPQADEEEALRTGLSLGMTLIDTAEVYGSEEFIGGVIAGQRNRVLLVSKVWPSHVAGNGIPRTCEASLHRFGTGKLHPFLLQCPNGVPALSGPVTAFENLRSAGKIRAWGVSNFKVSDLEDLFRIPQGDRCATNQVPYNIGDRSIEHDLLPWCQQHSMPVMAYSPLGGPTTS